MNFKKAFNFTLKTVLLLVVISGAIASAISAIWTIIPDISASKVCLLGYKSHCSFTPFSTIILMFMSIVFCYICLKFYRKYVGNGD